MWSGLTALWPLSGEGGLCLCPSDMPEHVQCTEASFGRVEVVFVYSTLGWVFVHGA